MQTEPKRQARPRKYSRRERRKLTLAAAKRTISHYGLPRSKLNLVWRDLMFVFPKGTLPEVTETVIQ